MDEKVTQLAELILQSNHATAFTGAGIMSLQKTLIPSRKYMAFVELMNKKHIKTIVTQNPDSLHLRSGIPENKLFELGGNQYMEVCTKCGKNYLRDFITNFKRNHGQKLCVDHSTGRKCDNVKCGGALKDMIIHGGQDIEKMTKGWS